MTERFLSLKEVGERLGVKNPAAKGYNLPEPDAPDRRDARLAAGDHRPVERGASRPRGRWRQTAQTSRGVSESPRSLVCERRGDSVGWVEVI